MNRRIVVGMVLLCWLSGCSRGVGLRCEDQERYRGANEAELLRIPDDLDPPDDTEALRIPRAVTSTAGPGTGGETGEAASCMEAPPEFFEEGLPG